MNCLRCNTQNEPDSNYCKNCGLQFGILALSASNKSNSDTVLFLIYIGWHLLSLIIYTFLMRVVVPRLVKADKVSSISEIYKMADWISSAIDTMILVIMVALLRNKYARIFCAIYLAIRVVLIVSNLLFY